MPSDDLSIVWIPTFRCPLVCAFCAARAMPVVTHGTRNPHFKREDFTAELKANELSPQQWIDAFRAWTRPVKQIAVTGGEPSVYHGLGEVLAAVDWPICIDTNLRIDPAVWCLPEVRPRVKAVNAGLQFDPRHEESVQYWERLRWLRETLPEAQIVCVHVFLWRDLPEQWDVARKMAEDIGAEFRPTTFDDHHLYRERVPIRPGYIEECDGGYRFVVIMPDGAMYRCIGHGYYTQDCLGNVTREGWSALAERPYRCDTILCTICDMCAKSGIREQTERVKPTLKG